MTHENKYLGRFDISTSKYVWLQKPRGVRTGDGVKVQAMPTEICRQSWKVGDARGSEKWEGGDVMENSVICVRVTVERTGVWGDDSSLCYRDNLFTMRLLLINHIFYCC